MYHTSTADLEKKPIVNFILEYAEAAEDLAEERKDFLARQGIEALYD